VNNNSNTDNTLLMSCKAHLHAWLCQQTDLSAAGYKHPTWTSPCPLQKYKSDCDVQFFFMALLVTISFRMWRDVQ